MSEQPRPAGSRQDEFPTLGSCCNCGRNDDTVRNIVMLERKSPEPGIGCWGCLTCGLPQAGAVAVLCDECLGSSNAQPQRIVLGSPADNRRLPISEVPNEIFKHDKAKHEELLGGLTGTEPDPELRKFAAYLADEIIDQLLSEKAGSSPSPDQLYKGLEAAAAKLKARRLGRERHFRN